LGLQGVPPLMNLPLKISVARKWALENHNNAFPGLFACV
jgi:hypothetical protein